MENLDKQPLVSVIIPTFSRPANLCRAIDSVLAQTYKPIEIIVVDDNGIGSPQQKETMTLLSGYINSKQLKYICHETNKNGSAARNTGVMASKGEIIALMDDDDVFVPAKIEKQVCTLLKKNKFDEGYQGCYCNSELRMHNGKVYITENRLEGNLTQELLLEEVRFNSTAIILFKKAYSALGGFDERYFRHQDWEFCLRFFQIYKMALAKEPLIIKYQTPNVFTRNPSRAIEYKEFFLSNFQDTISNCKKTKEIYHKQYYDLSALLIYYGLFSKGMFYLRKSLHYKHLSIVEAKKIIIKFLSCIYHRRFLI
jgi:glycosyltransferase involved in cell wall biosynthesis